RVWRCARRAWRRAARCRLRCAESGTAGRIRTGGCRGPPSRCAGTSRAGARRGSDPRAPPGACAEAMTSQLRAPTAVAGIDSATALAEIELGAFRSNVGALQAHAGVPAMVVVKADGYGHGILP